MKNCISVADVQMCWIVYSSHDMYIVGISKGNIRPDPDIWQKTATLVPTQEFLCSYFLWNPERQNNP